MFLLRVVCWWFGGRAGWGRNPIVVLKVESNLFSCQMEEEGNERGLSSFFFFF